MANDNDLNIVDIELINGGKMPCYANYDDACMDIFSNEDLVLKSMERKLVKTGVKMRLNEGYELLIKSKSGLALNHGVFVLNAPGVIDAGYRGEIGVILQNLSNEDYEIKRYDKVAQISLEKVNKIAFREVKIDNISTRGEGGFGSTGK